MNVLPLRLGTFFFYFLIIVLFLILLSDHFWLRERTIHPFVPSLLPMRSGVS